MAFFASAEAQGRGARREPCQQPTSHLAIEHWIGALILRVERTEPAAQRLASLTRETWSRTSADRFATPLSSLHPAEPPTLPPAPLPPLRPHRPPPHLCTFQFP